MNDIYYKIASLEYEFLNIKDILGFPHPKFHNTNRRYIAVKEFDDIVSRFTCLKEWWNRPDSWNKFYDELAEHFVMNDLERKPLSDVLSVRVIYKIYIDKNTVLFRLNNTRTIEIYQYRNTVRKYIKLGATPLNVMKLCVLYYNMRSFRGSNWSPFSSYPSLQPELNPIDLSDYLKIECYSSINNNQKVLYGINIDAICVLQCEQIKHLLGEHAGNIVEAFPEGALNYLKDKEFNNLYLMLNPVYSELEIERSVIGARQIIEKYPDKKIIIEGSYPNWVDIFEETHILGGFLKEFNADVKMKKNDMIKNGEHISKKINFTIRTFRIVIN